MYVHGPELFKVSQYTDVMHFKKYKTVKACISGTMKDSWKILTDLNSLGSRLGLKEIVSSLKV
jgi:hypothetical protein